jgi:hypothetical protein
MSINDYHPSPTKHYATGKHQHLIGRPQRLSHSSLTNHERCVIGRSKRLGISVAEYKRMFPRGGPVG